MTYKYGHYKMPIRFLYLLVYKVQYRFERFQFAKVKSLYVASVKRKTERNM